MSKGYKNKWLSYPTWIVVICAVVVTGLVVRRELGFGSAGPMGSTPVLQSIADWRAISETGHRAGPIDARVTIVEFVDFQCSYCRTFAKTLRQIRHRYEDDVALVFRHFPLAIHADAEYAAVASECAGQQGVFWGYHDALFADQDAIGERPWLDFATEAKVRDLDRFRQCVSDGSSRAAVQRDLAVAQRLGIMGTPTFLLNDRMFGGAPAAHVLEREINDVLGR